MTDDKDLASLLRFDALDAAEQFTGVSYKVSDITMQLGFGLMQTNSAAKDEALKARGDTVFNNTLERYIAIIEGAGYEKVYEEDFIDDKYPDHGIKTNTYYIYAHRDGLLLAFDTYGGKDNAEWPTSVNGGKVYYNWVPNPLKEGEKRDYGITSSGYTNKAGVHVGDHDCREALLFNMDRLRANGSFLPVWGERPYLSLLHYMDWAKQPDYKVNYDAYSRYAPDVTERKIEKLPDWVKLMIGEAR